MCPLHKGKRSDFQNICLTFVGDCDVIHNQNIIKCCVEVSRKGSDALTNIILYIFDAFGLVGVARELGIPNIGQRTSKAVCAKAIVTLAMKLTTFQGNAKAMKALVHIQRRWRIVGLKGDIAHASNDTDPFTQTPIKELPDNDLFAYTDPQNIVWAFSAKNLYYYVTNENQINPFTREDIPDSDINRLRCIVDRSNDAITPFTLDNCTTVDQMYTYALGFYEREGFYLVNEWFLALTTEEFDGVRHEVMGNAWTRVVDHKSFVELMLHIVLTSSPTRFADICAIISAVARFIPEMYTALPDWIFTAV